MPTSLGLTVNQFSFQTIIFCAYNTEITSSLATAFDGLGFHTGHLVFEQYYFTSWPKTAKNDE
jgi:hypothetical protein